MNDTQSTIQAAFPPRLAAEAASVAGLVWTGLAGPVGWRTDHCFEAELAEGTVSIPERLYVDVLTSPFLSPVGKRMRLCLLTRHQDGRVREAALRGLIGGGGPWTLPYLYRLIGEYVVEILQVIEEGLEAYADEDLRDFEARNPGLSQITRSRVWSYYDCYYRSAWPDRQAYPGFRILAALDARTKSLAPG